MPLELGLIGCGKQGREHLVPVEGLAVVAAVDPDSDARGRFGQDSPEVRLYADLPSMVGAESLDALIVALPHHVVPRVWPAVLQAGLPVLKEKPLGRSLPEALDLLARAERAGVPVVTAVQRRSHPSYLYLHELLQRTGAEIHAVAATLHLGFDPTRSTGSWRDHRGQAGGGALLDSGYHLVDLVQLLVGALELVSATLWTPTGPAGPGEIESDALVQARAGQTWVRIESRVGGRKHERLVLDTSLGRLEADRTGVWRNGEQVFASDRGWSAGMVHQLERFAAMVRSGSFDTPVVWDQVAAMRLVQQSYDALGHVRSPEAP